MKTSLLIFSLPVLLLTILLSGYGVKDYPNEFDEPSSTFSSQTTQNFLPVSYPRSEAVCTYTWSAQVSGTVNDIASVCAVSDMVGWIAGNGATVRKTINGGTTWTDANPNPGVISGDIYNIYASDANTAFVTTTPGATNIYRTVDGGTTWTLEFSQTGGFIDAIQMISASEGYAIGDPVGGLWTILRTTDGGDTWARIATEPAQVGSEAGWNNSFQIIGNNMWFGTNNTRVYRSTDLGLTWSSGATTGTLNTFALRYNSVLSGMAAGSAAATPIVRSIDGGATYSAVPSPNGSGTIWGLGGNGTDWWVVRALRDTIYRTTDHGATWPTGLKYVQTGAQFQAINLATQGGCAVGWAAGVGGSLAKLSPAYPPMKVSIALQGLQSNLVAPRVKDTVTIVIRETTSPYPILEQFKVFLDSAFNGVYYYGSANVNFNWQQNHSYYIQVMQRQSISAWSNPVSSSSDSLNYDFTTGVSKTLGNNAILVNGAASIYTGDIAGGPRGGVGDGCIDLTDILAVYNESIVFATGPFLLADLNLDGIVDLSDIILVYNNAINFICEIAP